MAILATQLFDTLTENQDLLTANPSQPLGGVPWVVVATGPITAKAAAAAHGGRGLQMHTMTSPGEVSWAPDGDNETTATHVGSMYFRIDAQLTANVYVMGLLGDASRADWRISSDHKVTIRNGYTATGGESAESLELDTWYRAEWKVQTSGQELRIFEGESTEPYIAITGALGNNAHSRIQIGVLSSPSGSSFSFDTFRVGDDWVGPYGTPTAPIDTPTGFTFVASNSAVEINAVWTAVSEALSYEVQVEELDDEWEPLGVFTAQTASLKLTASDGLSEGTAYRARVRALPEA